jgi:hypothetical protein
VEPAWGLAPEQKRRQGQPGAGQRLGLVPRAVVEVTPNWGSVHGSCSLSWF